jgi:hypothetical protein
MLGKFFVLVGISALVASFGFLATAAQAQTFTDVAASAGVDSYNSGFGIAWGDYDNDGDLDIYLSNYGGVNQLYRNNGNGTFTDVGASAGVSTAINGGVAWGDYDNDGDLDLYLSNTLLKFGQSPLRNRYKK